MGSSNENPKRLNIVAGEFYPTKESELVMPPEKSIKIGASSILLNGELNINFETYTGIKEKDGTTVARIANKNPKILTSKELIKEKSEKAVVKFMEEKNIKSVKELIENNKIVKRDKKEAEIG